eukprot:11149429-Lingulodinium_polyedra.AAC.1
MRGKELRARVGQSQVQVPCCLSRAAPGHVTEVADVEPASVQADMIGTPTWICLPQEQRRGTAKTMRRPVCRLLKALHGHPDS